MKNLQELPKFRDGLSYSTNNEQGFSIRLTGDKTRSVVDLDGLFLVGVKNARWQELLEQH